jgi:dipeptidyl aminopeptidase/acylaminoacyl peptidase
VHGESDRVVPASATTTLATALRAAGHPVRTALLPAATHDNVYRPETVLSLLLDWLSAQT